MQTPYTPQFAQSFAAAQIALGVTLTALVAHRLLPDRRAPAIALSAAITAGAMAPVVQLADGAPLLLPGVLLLTSALLAGGAAYAMTAMRTAVVSLTEAVVVSIAWLVMPSTAAFVIGVAHLCFIAGVVQVATSVALPHRPATSVAPTRTRTLDVACVILAVGVAAATCLRVTERYASSPMNGRTRIRPIFSRMQWRTRLLRRVPTRSRTTGSMTGMAGHSRSSRPGGLFSWHRLVAWE